MDEPELLEGFVEEAKEHLAGCEPNLLILEKDPAHLDTLNKVFRAIHSVKGASGFFALEKIEKLSHEMEGLLSLARKNQLTLQARHIDALLSGIDKLSQMIEDVGNSNSVDIAPELLKLSNCASAPSMQKTEPPPPPKPAVPNVQASAPHETTPPAPTTPPPIPETIQAPAGIKISGEEMLKVPLTRLDKLVNLAGELVSTRNKMLRLFEDKLKEIPELESSLHSLNLITHELQSEIMNTRMQPVQVLFGKIPRMVRDLAKSLGKDVDVAIEGEEVEVDKTVIEALSDPLTHMVRNTVDHGIEMPAVRETNGKPRAGRLLLRAYHEGGQVHIAVSDDGRGMDPDKIAAKAFEKKLITQADVAKFSKQEKINLIFMPGFSTAETVSSISGRGVGMDVVKANIEKVGGNVTVDTELGKGTAIRMTLPLTLAIASGVIVETQNTHWIIPQVNIQEMLAIQPHAFKNTLARIKNKDVFRLRGEILPLLHLDASLGIPRFFTHPETQETLEDRRSHFSDRRITLGEPPQPIHPDRRNAEDRRHFSRQEPLKLLVVASANYRFGLIVDHILDTEEVVIKPIPEFVEHLKSFSGATILGDGRVALILDIEGLAQTMKLEELDLSTHRKTNSSSELEDQSFLWFDNGGEETFVVPLPLVQRLESIDTAVLQNVGDKEYLHQDNITYQIFRLENYLPISKPGRACSTLLIPKSAEGEAKACFLIHRILDTVTLPNELNQHFLKQSGILGSTTVNGKMALLLDIHALIEKEFPKRSGEDSLLDADSATLKILLTEDTPFYQVVEKAHLESLGFSVTCAGNGVEALHALKKELFHVLLCDIEMPVLNGWELIEKVKAQPRYKDLPVIAFTSNMNEDDIQRGKKSGFSHWISKLDKAEMIRALKDVLSKTNKKAF